MAAIGKKKDRHGVPIWEKTVPRQVLIKQPIKNKKLQIKSNGRINRNKK